MVSGGWGRRKRRKKRLFGFVNRFKTSLEKNVQLYHTVGRSWVQYL